MQNWVLRWYVPAFLCRHVYFSSSFSLRISRLIGGMGVWWDLGLFIIGLDRQQDFYFEKYFKVLMFVSKCNETKTLPSCFCQKKKKIWRKKGKIIHTVQQPTAQTCSYSLEKWACNLEEHSTISQAGGPFLCPREKEVLSVFLIKKWAKTIGH